MKIERGAPSARSSEDYSIKIRLEFIEKYVPLKGKRVLDVGCGNGFYTNEMARRAKEVVGVDVNCKSIDEATRLAAKVGLKNVNFVCSSVENYHAEEKFDVITLIEVLEHVDDEHAVICNLEKMLKDSGKLVIFVPNKWYPFETHGAVFFGRDFEGWKGSVPLLSWAPEFVRRRCCRARVYTLGSLEEILSGCGFDAEAHDYFPPPLDLLGNNSFIKFLRILISFMHKTPLRIFFMSLFLVAVKSEIRDSNVT